MMAECRREQEEESIDGREIRSRNQPTDRSDRTKPDHLHSSQGPLSSIRAAIKRTKTITQSDRSRERRRPEITILSAEPLASSTWFPGSSRVFPPPLPSSQPSWSSSITTTSKPPPSYDQVIKEKTREEHTTRPVPAPRKSTCITSSSTQTDPVTNASAGSTQTDPVTNASAGSTQTDPVTNASAGSTQTDPVTNASAGSTQTDPVTNASAGSTQTDPVTNASAGSTQTDPVTNASAGSTQTDPVTNASAGSTQTDPVTNASAGSTQTDPVTNASAATDPPCTAAPQSTERKSVKRPRKPPRPSLPKTSCRETSAGTVASPHKQAVATNTTSTNTESLADLEANPPDSTHTTSIRSVTVHWDVYREQPAESVPVTLDSPDFPAEPPPVPTQHPVPLPRRSKTLKQPIKADVKVQTLIRLSENGDSDIVTSPTDPEELQTNTYLKELLEVFVVDSQCEHSSDTDDQLDDSGQSEHQHNMQARILAFESQGCNDGGDGVKRPQPRPRNLQNRPPVTTKPSVTPKPSAKYHNGENHNQEASLFPQIPTPAPKPQPPKKPVGLSRTEEPEAMPFKVALLPPTRRSVLVKAKSFDLQDEDTTLPLKPPPKEPLKPNLNVNNHNSTSLVRENQYVETPTKPTTWKPQHSVDSAASVPFPRQGVREDPPPSEYPARLANVNVNNHNSTSLVRENDYVETPTKPTTWKPQHSVDSDARPGVTRRPTTIRVPSKASQHESMDFSAPPPLPFQKPVGSLPPPVAHKTSLVPVLPSTEFFNTGLEPTLPPRPSEGRSLPPRPPMAKAGPGRPPPPGGSGSTQSARLEAPPKPQSQTQKPKRKGPVLPPRPNPGHRLYNRYTLQLPHGIAIFDYNGTNTGELSFQKNEVLVLIEDLDHGTFKCQVGDASGRVQKSHMKVMTPLSSSVLSGTHPQDVSSVGSGTDSCGIKVQVLHDFEPEGPTELRLKAGDVVNMVDQVNSEWYRGTCKGSSGFFPISYVKVLSNSSTPVSEKKAKPAATTISGPRCVARFDFEGEHSDELSFCEGDVIRLQECVGEDWARGQLGVFSGIFPLNFVEVIQDLPPPPSQTQQPTIQPTKMALPGMAASSSSKPIQTSQSGVEWVVALYDFTGQKEGDLSFQQGDRILVTQHIDGEWSSGRLDVREGIFPTAFVESSIGTGQSSGPDHQQVGARGKALYDFTSNCDEELTLQAGDIITNLESIDQEWFLGDLRGKRALVPKDYVQVLG